MKKICFVLSIFTVILLFVSCSSSKEARSFKKTVNGSWQLQTVVSEGITGKVKVELFNEADFNCFVGSIWNFNNKNNLGSYTIAQNAGECAAIKREIRWSIYESAGQPSLFQFKRLDSKLKDLDENSGGFRFTILQIDNNTMKLKSDITFEGKPAAFIYNFVKN